MVNVKKLIWKELRAKHPEVSAVLQCDYRYFGIRYFLLIGEERVDCTEEFLSIAAKASQVRLAELANQV